MDITILPQKLNGIVDAIPSKSQAHRLLICAALADSQTNLVCPQTNQDIEATADCLQALGATIERLSWGYRIQPIQTLPERAVLQCRESGSTLRFMLPIVAALGVNAVFKTKGRLSKRPLSPLWEEMERMGCSLKWLDDDELSVTGKLCAGDYYIDGGVSSQFITGLLFAASILKGQSQIHILGKLESRPYAEMTQTAMSVFGIDTADFVVYGGHAYRTPGTVQVEGDWSNAAFFLAAKAIGNHTAVRNLNLTSPQGDRAIADLLPALEERISISAADIPDLVPILAVTAAAKQGAIFTDIQRLRLKESDRVNSTISMLKALGIYAEATESTLTVYPGSFTGGTVDSVNDHRIAMAAAIAATAANGPVTILDAQCVQKSYPHFWDEYRKLGGQYEQHIR